MADYVSQWSGPLIDTGINLALNGIGCKKYPDATLDRPLDLNKLHDQIQLSSGESISANGSWLVDFYINGPVLDLSSINSTNYTPIQIDVYTYRKRRRKKNQPKKRRSSPKVKRRKKILTTRRRL